MSMKRIEEKRVVPVVSVSAVDDAVNIAAALTEAGLDIIEITLRTDLALDAIAAVREKFPQMLVGAGTIIFPDQVDQAMAAGAAFGVAPGLSEPVVSRARERSLPFVPGVMTPSDVEAALGLGCQLLKFFPAEPIGGVAMLKAMAAPYAHLGVKFIPLGGVSPYTAPNYLALKCVAAVGGSWIASASAVAEGDWTAITALASEALVMGAH